MPQTEAGLMRSGPAWLGTMTFVMWEARASERGSSVMECPAPVHGVQFVAVCASLCACVSVRV